MEEEHRSAQGCGPSRRYRHRSRRARQERVLHTRISEQLAEDIRRVAEDLRVPVSNLVRNVLEEAFDVVETVTDNVGELVEEVMEEAESARDRVRRRRRHHRVERDEEPAADEPVTERAPHPDVIGWQPLVLNRAGACADCEEPLEPGEHAYAGLTAEGRASTLLCRDCTAARRNAAPA